MSPRQILLVLLAMIVTGGTLHADDRRGLRKFRAFYDGGYNIEAGEETGGGASRIDFRSTQSGRSGRMTWTNIFYSELGRKSTIRTTLTFGPSGNLVVSTIDPRQSGPAGSGSYTLRNRRLTYTATSGSTTVNGTIRLVGGGALNVEQSLPDGIIRFNGGRK